MSWTMEFVGVSEPLLTALRAVIGEAAVVARDFDGKAVVRLTETELTVDITVSPHTEKDIGWGMWDRSPRFMRDVRFPAAELPSDDFLNAALCDDEEFRVPDHPLFDAIRAKVDLLLSHAFLPTKMTPELAEQAPPTRASAAPASAFPKARMRTRLDSIVARVLAAVIQFASKSFSLGFPQITSSGSPGSVVESGNLASRHPSDDKYAVVPVHFGTNRTRTKSRATPYKYFGAGRGSLVFGRCDVTIPDERKLGTIPRPSIWSLEFSESPEKHATIHSLEETDRDTFLRDVRPATKDNGAFIFVHGYNVKFSEAILRTAQMTHDLGFGGVAVLFSWPSLGTLAGYPADEATVQWSIPDFRSFLEHIIAAVQPSPIHLIGHSMGNRLIGDVLQLMFAANPKNKPLTQLFTAAPDVDAGVFAQIAPALAASARRVTLYASCDDKAIVASRVFHRAPRAGEGRDALVVTQHTDSVDASNLTPLAGLAHSYIGDDPDVLADVHQILNADTPPLKRFGLKPHTKRGGWIFADR